MMEESKLRAQLFRAINYVIEQSGYLMRGGTIVDATIINAPSSTKNAQKSRDPEMNQTIKGNEWHSGYLGIQKREEIQSDEHLFAIEYRINRRPGTLPKVSDNAIDWNHYIENRKSSTRCKVEHLFHIIKNLFGYLKAVYRGLSKNLNRLHILCASANLLVLARAGRRLRRV